MRRCIAGQGDLGLLAFCLLGCCVFVWLNEMKIDDQIFDEPRWFLSGLVVKAGLLCFLLVKQRKTGVEI